MPPIVRLKNIECIAYQDCVLSAEQTIDSLNDLNGLTTVWDLDITIDSNGDGIKDNDADLVGSTVIHMFRKAGNVRVKAMAWDENPERPGQSTMIVEVAPPERTSIEQVGAALIGDEANPLAQIGLLLATLFILASFTRRKKTRPDEESWQQGGLEGEDVEAKRPGAPPPLHTFTAAMEIAPQGTGESQSQINDQQQENQADSITELHIDSPPIPEDGLPEGWSEDQWHHFGQQYLDSLQ